ncbi:hypothetical protein PIB30_019910 [Stylosanthes scabra]|uniref:Uncharacterized protein n=1 Tax=Stylosanthes scabra TaxID=79078 RepID=A0ABU6VAM2_9FABA|nr:hypothetical protein [Stylosanthes scabra]
MFPATLCSVIQGKLGGAKGPKIEASYDLSSLTRPLPLLITGPNQLPFIFSGTALPPNMFHAPPSSRSNLVCSSSRTGISSDSLLPSSSCLLITSLPSSPNLITISFDPCFPYFAIVEGYF